MNDLTSMFAKAKEDGECTAVIEGFHVDDLRIAVLSEGYQFATDGHTFSVIKKRQPINYAKTGTV